MKDLIGVDGSQSLLRKVSRNFGGVGTFRCRHGSKTIYIFRWEGIEWGITDICGICL